MITVWTLILTIMVITPGHPTYVPGKTGWTCNNGMTYFK